jgi:hypothetical protein
MKHLIFISMITASFASVSWAAVDCKEKIISASSPHDRLETLYSCELFQTTVGNPDYGFEKLCYGSFKDQYSGFKDTWYKTYRYHDDDFGGYLTIVVQKASGDVIDGYVQQKGSLLTLGSTEHTSGTSGEKWIEETVVDQNAPWNVVFKTYDKGWMSNKLTYSATYMCKRLQ